jgi:3-methyladenine DNA glycosylase AlkD
MGVQIKIPPQTAASVLALLKKVGTKTTAQSSARFFKTGKEGYAKDDVFIGITVPEVRSLSRAYGELPLSEILILLKNKIHECRLTALIILVGQYKNAKDKDKEKIVKFYLDHATLVNNWDLVDTSASAILGEHLLTRERDVLYRLARSKNLWEKRIAIVATNALIRHGQFNDTLSVSDILLSDTHDLIHKAVGWMLREVGKRSRETLVSYLELHAHHMPRTTLRYAIEHFSEVDRVDYMRRASQIM